MDNSNTQTKTNFSKTIDYYMQLIDQEIKIKQNKLDKLERKKQIFLEISFN